MLSLAPASQPAAPEKSVSRIRNGIFSSNTYFYAVAGTRDCIVVDPGLDFEGVAAHLNERGLNPIGIACTHGHFDHVGSAQPLRDKYGIQLALHARDIKTSKAANFLLMACKIEHRIATPTVDIEISESDSEIVFGRTPVRFLHVPGHTPGSCFVIIGGSVFTGDTLYRNAIGLVDFPGEDKDQLKRSILGVWDVLPDSFMIYPGHGGSDTFGNIKAGNKALRGFLGFEAGVPDVPIKKGVFPGESDED